MMLVLVIFGVTAASFVLAVAMWAAGRRQNVPKEIRGTSAEFCSGWLCCTSAALCSELLKSLPEENPSKAFSACLSLRDWLGRTLELPAA